jgi:hypothetical protein
MAGVGWQPTPEGFREARYDANTGVQLDQRTPAEIKAAQEKVLADREAAMKRYDARVQARQKELVKRAAGIRDEPEPEPERAFDELDLVLQQFRSQPELLHGRGPLGEQLAMRGGTEAARRLRQTTALDAAQVEAAETLTKWVSPEKEEDPYDFTGPQW